MLKSFVNFIQKNTEFSIPFFMVILFLTIYSNNTIRMIIILILLIFFIRVELTSVE